MPTIATTDGIEILLKDWGSGQPIVFSHGSPRVIAHDRRGDGEIHVAHSTGGDEVVCYIARHRESRFARAVLINAVPSLMMQARAAA